MRSRVLLAAKLTLAVALLVWLARAGHLPLREFARLRDGWPWFVAANAFYGLAQLIAAARWRALLAAQSIHYGFAEIWKLTLIGLFFNQMIFGSTGGDLVRGWAVTRDHRERAVAAAMSVLVDRVVGLAVLLVLTCVIALPRLDFVATHAGLAPLLGAICTALLAALVGVWVLLSPGVRAFPPVIRLLAASRMLGQAVAAFDLYAERHRVIAIAAAQSVLLHAGVIAANLCLVRALHAGPVDWWAVALFIPLAHLAMTIPLNPPGAIGTAEAIYAYLFGLIGIGHGSLVSLLQRGMFYVWAGWGGLIWLRGPMLRTSAPRAAGDPGAARGDFSG